MMASNTDDSVLDINSLSQFTIPKKKKVKKDSYAATDLYEELSLESRDCIELLRLVRQSYKDKDGAQNFQFTRAQLIHNSEFQNTYFERKKEMKQDGYSDKEIQDLYAFLHADNAHGARGLCEKGAMVNNCKFTSLGHPEMGVSLCRHADIIKPSIMNTGTIGKLVVFKVIKGKMKTLVENHDGPPLEPTPNFDCHTSRNANVDLSSVSPAAAFESTQMYVYEYGDLGTEQRPRHVCPYAVLDYRFVGQTKSYRNAPQKNAISPMKSSISPIGGRGMSRNQRPPMLPSPKQHPPLSNTPSPRSTASPKLSMSPRSGPSTPSTENSASFPPPLSPRTNVGKTVAGDGLVVWTGPLSSRVRQICDVELVSYNSKMLKPARIGPTITISKKMSLSKVRNTYLQQIVTLPMNEEYYSNGSFFHYALMRPGRDGRTAFLSLVKSLAKKDFVAKVSLDGGTEMLLLTNCDMTMALGINQPNSDQTILHCIFVSKHSRKGLQYIAATPVMSPVNSLSRSGSSSSLGKYTPPPRTPTPGSNLAFEKGTLATVFCNQQDQVGEHQRQTHSPFIAIQPSPSPKSIPSPAGLENSQDGNVFKEPPEPTRVASASPVADENVYDEGFQKFVPVSSLIYRESICRAFDEMAVTQDKRNVEMARRRGSAGSRSSRTSTPSPAAAETGQQQRTNSAKSAQPSPSSSSNTSDLSSLLGIPSLRGDNSPVRPGFPLAPPRGSPMRMPVSAPGPGQYGAAGFSPHGTRPPDLMGRMLVPQQQQQGFGGGGPQREAAVVEQGFGQVSHSQFNPQYHAPPQASHMYGSNAMHHGLQFPPGQAGGMMGRSHSQHAFDREPRPLMPHRSGSMPEIVSSGSPLSALASTVQSLTNPQAAGQIPGLGFDTYHQGAMPLVEPNVYPGPMHPQQNPASNPNLTQSLSVGTSPRTGGGTCSNPSGGTMPAPYITTGASSTPNPGNNSPGTGDMALPRTTEGLTSTERGYESKEEQPYDPGTELFPGETESKFSYSSESEEDEDDDDQMLDDIVKGKTWQESDDDEEDEDEDDEDMDDDLINAIVKNHPLAGKSSGSDTEKPPPPKPVEKAVKVPTTPEAILLVDPDQPRKKTLKEILQMSEESAKSRTKSPISLSVSEEQKRAFEFTPPAPKEIPTEITPLTEEEKKELEHRISQRMSTEPKFSASTAAPTEELVKDSIPQDEPVKEVKDPPDKPPDKHPPDKQDEKPHPLLVQVAQEPKKASTPEKSPVKAKPVIVKKSATACATRDPKLGKNRKRTFKPQIKGDTQASPNKIPKADSNTVQSDKVHGLVNTGEKGGGERGENLPRELPEDLNIENMRWNEFDDSDYSDELCIDLLNDETVEGDRNDLEMFTLSDDSDGMLDGCVGGCDSKSVEGGCDSKTKSQKSQRRIDDSDDSDGCLDGCVGGCNSKSAEGGCNSDTKHQQQPIYIIDDSDDSDDCLDGRVGSSNTKSAKERHQSDYRSRVGGGSNSVQRHTTSKPATNSGHSSKPRSSGSLSKSVSKEQKIKNFALQENANITETGAIRKIRLSTVPKLSKVMIRNDQYDATGKQPSHIDEDDEEDFIIRLTSDSLHSKGKYIKPETEEEGEFRLFMMCMVHYHLPMQMLEFIEARIKGTSTEVRPRQGRLVVDRVLSIVHSTVGDYMNNQRDHLSIAVSQPHVDNFAVGLDDVGRLAAHVAQEVEYDRAPWEDDEDEMQTYTFVIEPNAEAVGRAIGTTNLPPTWGSVKEKEARKREMSDLKSSRANSVKSSTCDRGSGHYGIRPGLPKIPKKTSFSIPKTVKHNFKRETYYLKNYFHNGTTAQLLQPLNVKNYQSLGRARAKVEVDRRSVLNRAKHPARFGKGRVRMKRASLSEVKVVENAVVRGWLEEDQWKKAPESGREKLAKVREIERKLFGHSNQPYFNFNQHRRGRDFP